MNVKQSKEVPLTIVTVQLESKNKKKTIQIQIHIIMNLFFLLHQK